MPDRVALPRRRSLAMLVMASVLLTGCPHLDYPAPVVTLGEVNYNAWASATIPPTELTPIGGADGFEDRGGYSHVTSRTVYAIRGVDRRLAVAMAIDADRWLADFRAAEGDLEPPPVPTHEIFVAADGVPPPELCTLFDPRSDETPSECQAPIRLALDGTTYRPWPVPDPTFKALHGVFSFPASALRNIGSVDAIDDRLGSVADPTAYAVQDIDPELVIVLVGSGGPSEDALVFLAESASDAPPGLCRYSVAAEVTGCP